MILHVLIAMVAGWLQATLHEAGWPYACRTAMSTTATWDGTPCRLNTLGACRKPGQLIEGKNVHVTREAYGPIMGFFAHPDGYVPQHICGDMWSA